MSFGIPYDSDRGRDYAGAISAMMCGQAYLTSARIAGDATGPFPGYAKNEEPFLEVIRMHRDAVHGINHRNIPSDLYAGAKTSWEEAYETGKKSGYRNGQVTVIAPTGTIGFMMDCDTTGIEPDLALVKYKKLVGGGDDQDRQQYRARGADQAGLFARAGGSDCQPHRCDRDDRRGAGAEERAPRGVRLQFPSAERCAVDPLHGSSEDDGRGAAFMYRARFRRPSTCRKSARWKT